MADNLHGVARRHFRNSFPKTRPPPIYVTDYGTVYGVRTDDVDYQIVVRFDKSKGRLKRFAVQLQKYHRIAEVWRTIAQLDHAPYDPNGHDVYKEGLHVDIYQRSGEKMKLYPQHDPLPRKPGAVLRICTDYLKENVDWFRKAYSGDIGPNGPPRL